MIYVQINAFIHDYEILCLILSDQDTALGCLQYAIKFLSEYNLT